MRYWRTHPFRSFIHIQFTYCLCTGNTRHFHPLLLLLLCRRYLAIIVATGGHEMVHPYWWFSSFWYYDETVCICNWHQRYYGDEPYRRTNELHFNTDDNNGNINEQQCLQFSLSLSSLWRVGWTTPKYCWLLACTIRYVVLYVVEVEILPISF